MAPERDLLIASGERESRRGQDLPPGAPLANRYEVLGLLGSGGMAEVYEVEHRSLGRRFALKVLRPELVGDKALSERFEREARAVAKLESEHIVAIIDSGVAENGAPYFVMERLYGQELRRLLEREGTLPLQRALYLALDVCRALTVAHGAGVIHRDLKPENLYVTQREGGVDLCKVLDFGVAKLTGENPTMPGTLMGTARYMAPEQISQQSSIGPATDVFSLSVILFECLTGTVPFAADTLERVLFKILNEAPPPLLELRPDLPPALAELIERGMAKIASERPQSAASFAQQLSRFALDGSSIWSAQPSNDDTLFQPVSSPTATGISAAKTNGAPPPVRRSNVLGFVVTFAVGLGVGLAASRGLPAPVSAELPATSASTPTALEIITTAAASPAAAAPTAASADASGKPSALAAPHRTLEPRASKTATSASSPPASPAVTSAPPPLFFPHDTGAPKP